MYKKLILMAASASFALAVQAAEQTMQSATNQIAPTPSDDQADTHLMVVDTDTRTDVKLDAVKPKAFADTTTETPVTELDTVIITAPLATKLSDATVPVTVLSGDELTMKMGHTIGETLKQELGITSQSFGPGVGTPVIRGQSGPRVRVLENGIGSNDVSQLSPDHATSIEPALAESIEVLRGPATLLYGSGAMGGVVNIIDNRIPTHLYSKPVNIVFDQRYDTAFNESSSAMKSEGSYQNWSYHIDGLYRDRGDMAIGGSSIDATKAQALDPTLSVVSNTHGLIHNTFAQTLNGALGGSYVTDKGFVGLGINQFHNNYGIAPDGGTSIQGANNTTYADPNVRIDQMQTKYDLKGELNNPFRFADKLKMRLGYTDYYHTEWDGGVPGITYNPGTAFSNKTYEGRVELTHKALGALNGAVGVQVISSQFAAFSFPNGGVPDTLIDPTAPVTNIVPNTQTNSVGVFGQESLDYGPVKYEVGIRVEDTTLTPNLSSSYTAPYMLSGSAADNYTVNSSYNYLPVSASASALWKLDSSNSLNMALTRSQRAPQVQELFANGFHDATRSYELGDPNLQMETSYNLDVGYKYKTSWVRAELDLFNNWANNYIYQQRTGEFVNSGFTPTLGNSLNTANAQCLSGSQGSCTPVTASYQAGAIFRGYESKLVFPIAELGKGALDLTLFSDYTNGTFVSTGAAVPRMPPLRFGFQWDYTHKDWTANLRFTRGQAQDRPGANDTTSAGYYLLTMGVDYKIKDFQDSQVLLYLKGNNLLNENIRNSVSYLRNFAPEPGRGAQLGIRITY
ncbi:TonB-dependent receptor [Methylomonas sp. AM2-LC]|uniref:TonB-dependent receptor n=1 Tax=Methylomonas sp. AM2-LC TaxID=3153301 RepID=UPI003262ECB5